MADIALLIHRFLKEELNDEERGELEHWKQQSESNRRIFERLTDDNYLLQAVSDGFKIDSDEVATHKMHTLIGADQQIIDKSEGIQTVNIKPMWPRFAVAAAILCLIAFSAVYIMRKTNQHKVVVAKQGNEKQDIRPGVNKATLTLADGRSIILDSLTTGQLVQQGGTNVLNKDGQLVYSKGTGTSKVEVLWNTLSTSKGQTYPLLLGDGSKITLNSESSISYPVAFTGDLREVRITGEVFFEVAHDASKPFIVSAGNMVLQDLGTSFNVNAYSDEDAVKATLVEGSILVKKGIHKKIIKPGQQAQVLPDDIKVTEVDVDKITAWKQGYFKFKEDKLSEAMKNIARWYNIDVVFEGDAKNVEISGDINRGSNLSEVLKILSLLKVDGRIEGRKLILKAQ
ncbi:MAG: FecR family protein [Niastella sp.]|uniref:FecR family protein n=1 Tax=Niastella sp. TaxID=1869183 RepID=UPI00389AA71B